MPACSRRDGALRRDGARWARAALAGLVAFCAALLSVLAAARSAYA